jgi:energy-coupling factor transporter ATP-binding protein EcfA2
MSNQDAVRHYRLCGMTVASAIELPGAIRVDAPAGPVDARIRRDLTLPTALPGASASGPNWSVADEQILAIIPSLARILLTAGSDIAVDAPATADNDIAAFLHGGVLAILLHQRRQIVLRASAISIGGKAILFCGQSGTGKSTLAAVMSARGHPFYADDLCSISLDETGVATIAADGTTLRLWDDVIDRLALTGRQGAALRSTVRKFHVEPPRAAAESHLPIAAVYMLREDHAAVTSRISPLPAGEAAMLLRRNSPVSHLAAATGTSGALFDRAITLQRRVKLFGLTRRMGFDHMAEVVGWLERHWQSLGLIAATA